MQMEFEARDNAKNASAAIPPAPRNLTRLHMHAFLYDKRVAADKL